MGIHAQNPARPAEGGLNVKTLQVGLKDRKVDPLQPRRGRRPPPPRDRNRHLQGLLWI